MNNVNTKMQNKKKEILDLLTNFEGLFDERLVIGNTSLLR